MLSLQLSPLSHVHASFVQTFLMPGNSIACLDNVPSLMGMLRASDQWFAQRDTLNTARFVPLIDQELAHWAKAPAEGMIFIT